MFRLTQAEYDAMLQLCRPLSVAVICVARRSRPPIRQLQLCRPLSGAVIGNQRVLSGAAISALQLCRPLSGAVIIRAHSGPHTPGVSFNCAAPFRERLYAIPS